MFALRHVSLLFLLGLTTTLAAPTKKRANEGNNPTVYAAWSRQKHPLQGDFAPPRGVEQPLRQNGTWIDVGIWDTREPMSCSTPFLFTLGPGRDENTHTIVQVDTGKKLAYSEGDVTLPVNYGSLAAFVLTDQGNTNKRVIDAWTVGKEDEKNDKSRTLLGLAKTGGSGKSLGFMGGKDWTVGGCAYTGEDICDGFYFMSTAGGFGVPAVIEIVEWDGEKKS